MIRLRLGFDTLFFEELTFTTETLSALDLKKNVSTGRKKARVL